MSLVSELNHFPVKSILVNGRRQTYREAGRGRAIVLLHGISSGAGSWINQLRDLQDQYHLIAWDAPGYGESEALANPKPSAKDYGEALKGMIDALALEKPLIIGHSLGAMMASGLTKVSDNYRGIMFANPAQGYGFEVAEKKQEIYSRRPKMLQTLGADGMADERGPHLLAPGAGREKLDLIRYSMQRLTLEGFTQASYLLSHDDIWDYMAEFSAEVAVQYGLKDGVTKPEGVERLITRLPKARAFPIEEAGHVSYVDAPAQFNANIIDFDQELK